MPERLPESALVSVETLAAALDCTVWGIGARALAEGWPGVSRPASQASPSGTHYPVAELPLDARLALKPSACPPLQSVRRSNALAALDPEDLKCSK